MKIRLKMFAVLRERSGVSEAELELEDEATVGTALEAVAGRYSSIANLLPRSSAAVNRAYARREDPLHDGDELALIPPVSGG